MREKTSWLVPEQADLSRMLDMDRRLQPIRRTAFAVLAVILLLTGPWIGYWTLIPLVVAAALFALADRQMERMARPEYGIFAAWAGSQIVIAASIVLAGEPGVYCLAWFGIPIVTLGARFSLRGTAVGVAITLALLVGVGFAAHADAIRESPPVLAMPLGLVLAVAILSTALMRSDVEHRSRSVVDPLTGMLNRAALETRVEELRQQSEIAPASIGLIVIDIDRFKDVNDRIGHAAGDRVLQDVAYIIRKNLRAYDLAYRLGGEEFLVLLPGADAEQSLRMGNALCASVADRCAAGDAPVTISCGVAATHESSTFEYDPLFEAADAAMYEAKRAGRNRVVMAGGSAARLDEPELIPSR